MAVLRSEQKDSKQLHIEVNTQDCLAQPWRRGTPDLLMLKPEIVPTLQMNHALGEACATADILWGEEEGARLKEALRLLAQKAAESAAVASAVANK